MSDKNIKTLRKQLRGIVQEILPEVLSAELNQANFKKLSAEITDRLNRVEKHILETLKAIDERQKNVQSFVMNEVSKQMAAPAQEVTIPALAPKDE